MSYIAFNFERFIDKSVGSGQCVAFVETAANTPRTFYWRQGAKVRNNFMIQKGTAIATFQEGAYQNNTHGFSHAALYIRQTPEGIYVLDQWIHGNKVQVVHERLIRFKGGIGKPVDDGDAYYVIESEDVKKAA